MNQEKTMDLTQGSIVKRLLRFSWPLMIANLLQIVYNLVDMVIVGQYLGSAGLSAVSCGSDIVQLATMLCMGFTSAVQIVIAQRIGSGERQRLSPLVGGTCVFFLLVSTGLSLIMIYFIDLLLRFLNTPLAVFEDARVYSIICLSATVFVFGYNTVSSVLRGMGDSLRPLIFIAVSSVINLILDMLFVAGLGWGVRGAALATAIGQAISCGVSVVYLYRKQQDFSLHFTTQDFRLDRQTVKILCRIGLPLALQGAAVNVSKLFVHSYINAYGVVISAVNGVGTKITQCSRVVSNAMATAGTSIVGQNFGAGKHERMKKTILSALGVSLVYNWVLAAVMLLFPKQIFGLFTGDTAVLGMAPTYAVVAALVFNGSALRVPFSALIDGQGNSRLSMLIGILDGIVCRIGFAVLLGLTLGLGIMGFWLGDVMASHVPAIVGGIYFTTGMWRKFQIPEEK